MARTITIDLDSADYGAAVTALEWAFHNAQRLGYTLPSGFDVALALLKREAQTSLYLSSSQVGGFYSVVMKDAEWEGEVFDDFMEMLTRVQTRKKERAKEAKSAAKVIGEFAVAAMQPSPDSLTCVDCGKPRSKGAERCRACFQERAAYAREIEQAANA